MIKLHGVTISNYYNTAKAALLEKDIPFEEVAVFPSQKPEVLNASPMGKVPWLEIEGQNLSETNVIFDYLEDVKPSPALYPADAFQRAKTKEIIRLVEQYLDRPARRHIATVYFGGPVDPIALEEVRPALESGLRALADLAKFDPFIAGAAFSFADITAYFQLGFANMHTQKIYDWDLRDSIPHLSEYLELVGQRPSVQAAATIMQRDLADFLPS